MRATPLTMAALLAALAAPACAGDATAPDPAEVLATIPMDRDDSINGHYSTLRMWAGYTDGVSERVALLMMPDTIEITTALRHTRYALAPGDPLFAELAARLTNGEDDVMTWGAKYVDPNGPGLYIVNPESSMLRFNPLVLPYARRDLRGSTIQRIEVEIGEVSIAHTDANKTEARIDIRILIMGTPGVE